MIFLRGLESLPLTWSGGASMKAAVMRALEAPLVDRGRRARRARAARGARAHRRDRRLPQRPARARGRAARIPPPTVLGHEPAGIVEAVGARVSHVAPGDHVIGCLSAFCGTASTASRAARTSARARRRCAARASRRGSRRTASRSRQFAHLSAFAERMLVHENALVKIRHDMPLDRAALIGCGVTTGLGAALNTARVRAGRRPS